MGCNGCATGESNLPKGCRSNGSCQTGSCNKLNTYNWLADLPIAFDTGKKFYEISFKNGSRKGFYKNDNNLMVDTGDLVIVESAMGYDVGEITLSGELVKIQMKKKKVKEKTAEIRNIKGIASEKELDQLREARAKEGATMIEARKIVKEMKLNMKIGDVEFQADNAKAIFYYTADDRVDFRELIKRFAHEFKVKVEMKQIGARQEAGKIGGIGDCGRELCCSTWLTEFKSVSTTAARHQNLSINMEKLSGQCGRLKCCLNYELDTYLDALSQFPKNAEVLKTAKGPANLQKTDILKQLMWYSYEDAQKYYPITVEKVNEIIAMNKEGEKPADIVDFAVYEAAPEEKEEQAADLVGHISLESLDKSSRKKHHKNKSRNRKNKGNRNNKRRR